jgi:hypothetical protein
MILKFNLYINNFILIDNKSIFIIFKVDIILNNKSLKDSLISIIEIKLIRYK